MDAQSLAVQTPWFTYTVLGLGVLMCLITCSGHVAAETASGSCLYIYMVLVFLVCVFEAAFTEDVFLNSQWEEDFPEDPTENLDKLKDFIKDNFDICKWIGFTVVALQMEYLWSRIMFHTNLMSLVTSLGQKKDYQNLRINSKASRS